MALHKRNNVVLLELIIVLLFFAISTTIILQVFVHAYQRSNESSRISEAIISAEDWAERISISGDPEGMLVDAGWTKTDEGYVMYFANELTIEISMEKSQGDAGMFLDMTIEVYNESPAERPLLVALPLKRYIPFYGGSA